MRLRMMKYGAAAAAVALMTLGVSYPAYANNYYLRLFQGSNYTSYEYDYLCTTNHVALNLIPNIESFHNNCGVQVWFRQNYFGSPGYNKCFNPRSSVAYMSETYEYPNFIYWSRSTAACP
jgi:hypothetical protein